MELDVYKSSFLILFQGVSATTSVVKPLFDHNHFACLSRSRGRGPQTVRQVQALYLVSPTHS